MHQPFPALGAMATPTSRGPSDDGEPLLTVIDSPDYASSIKMFYRGHVMPKAHEGCKEHFALQNLRPLKRLERPLGP